MRKPINIPIDTNYDLEITLISPITMISAKTKALFPERPEAAQFSFSAFYKGQLYTVLASAKELERYADELDKPVARVKAYFDDYHLVLGTPQDYIETQHLDAVVNSVLYMAWGRDVYVSKLHLNKILYYLQSAWLMTYDQKLFNETFSKGGYGPYIGQVNVEFKSEGSCAITKDRTWANIQAETKPDGTFDWDTVFFGEPREVTFEGTVAVFFKACVQNLLAIPAWDLVEASRLQSISGKDEIQSGNVTDYKLSEIKDFFTANPKECLWMDPQKLK